MTILFVIDRIALTVLVLLQEGKNGGLGALIERSSGQLLEPHKGRSMEGHLVKATIVLGALFIILALVS